MLLQCFSLSDFIFQKVISLSSAVKCAKLKKKKLSERCSGLVMILASEMDSIMFPIGTFGKIRVTGFNLSYPRICMLVSLGVLGPENYGRQGRRQSSYAVG